MVECGGLENHCTARYRGFESLSLRKKKPDSLNRTFFIIVFYYCSSFCKAAILMAVTAASVPLFPCFPPERSIACCRLLSVSTPKITALLYFKATSLIPRAVPSQTKSKCLVSPCITLPKHIIASQFFLYNILEPYTNSKLPGTSNFRILSVETPQSINVSCAPL